jgi:hypothetical protein
MLYIDITMSYLDSTVYNYAGNFRHSAANELAQDLTNKQITAKVKGTKENDNLFK